MMTAAVETTPARDGIRTPIWLAATISVFFGLFYAFDVWEALGNLLAIQQSASLLGLPISVYGWVVLIGAMVLPLALFALALWLGRNRGALALAAFLFVGLCVSAVIYLNIIGVFAFGPILDLSGV
ncbi:bacitracin resistance protein [Microterricola viridarii]|nr:bacitracin resistance protein [Microterricola viridarii]